MKTKKSIIAVISAFLAITLVFSGCTSNKVAVNEIPKANNEKLSAEQLPEKKYNEQPGTVRKSETVYVNLDNAGGTNNIIVSDWIHTDRGEVSVNDISDLQNIVNVKSNQKPKMNGNELTWNMETTDLYYRGESSKELPVTLTVKYFLDEKEMTAEEIAGKSGNVRVSIEMKNNVFTEKKIGGKKVKIYNPVIAVGAMILPEGQFQNITVKNGRSLGDGTKEIAIMMGFPGLSETLGIENVNLGDMGEISFAENFDITASVTDFSLSNIYFGVIPLSTLGAELKIPSSINELKDSLGKLKELQKVITEIDPNNILSALMQQPEKITEMVAMIDDAVSLYENNKELLALIPKYMTEENVNSLSKLITPENGKSSLQEMLTLLSNPVVQKFLKLLPVASQDLIDVLPMMQELSKELQKPEIQKSIENLPSTLESLTKLETQIKDNSKTINQLTEILSADNLNKLTSILDSANPNDFNQMLKKYGVLMDNSDELIDRVGAMLTMANEYKIFSTAPAGMDTSVVFVYQTPSIKAPVPEEITTAAPELSWYQKIFNKFKK